MASYTNFKNFGLDTSLPDGNGRKQGGNYPLARQSSVYSLTFDELQNTFGGHGKDFGSMNMEDLLKSIWTAEETQAMASTTNGGNGNAPGGNLQRQGSVTLPHTVSQKTVDEVWRDAFKDVGVEDGRVSGGSNFGQRQPTFSEVTLEEFLARAGVVREDIQPTGRPNAGGIYGVLPQSSGNNTGVTTRFQQPSANQGVMGNQLAEMNNVVLSSSSLGMNIGGVRSSQQQLQNPQPQVSPLFPKQTTLNFSSPVQTGNNGQLASHGTKGLVVGMSNPSMNNTAVRGGAMIMSGPRGGVTAVAGGSPGNHLASDTISKCTVDTSSLSSSPGAFGEGGRGRKSTGSLEKVVERRHRRMIKNRESAARSRARKQAYTLELEAEIAKLREMNQELQKKQAEVVEMQKNQVLISLF
ncbi:ABSCISIC ACID-INSENSITIVE 5 7 [Olea europaea subsp. europaea]|uniref:ABSCISIC ACID-INSENSITIVE 5 7 n=1 Tax=Olea europaea subsp. europaea TaxID=158383 RepID=A0A8S0RG09_OLEEU|nr:ABSCISIC ACID-INSENSITIVE 5 7 [Olea europaea subsp. europaea]